MVSAQPSLRNDQREVFHSDLYEIDTMGNNPSFTYYVVIVLTVINVLSLLVWFFITNLIKVSSGVSVSTTASVTDIGYSSLSATGNANNGTITFTIGEPVPADATLPITVTFPYVPPSSFRVGVFGLTVGNANATNLPFTVTNIGSQSFTFVNAFPFSANTTYTVGYVVTY